MEANNKSLGGLMKYGTVRVNTTNVSASFVFDF